VTGFILYLATLPIQLLRRTLKALSNNSNDSLRNVDVRGFKVIITGANTGIGKRTAATLAKLGATCILACRDKEKGLRAQNDLTSEISGSSSYNFPYKSSGSVVFIPFDASSLKSVHNFVQIVQERFDEIDILINNAGLNASGTTTDGLHCLFQNSECIKCNASLCRYRLPFKCL